MSTDKTPKKVLFLLNDDDFSRNLGDAIRSTGYTPLRVESIAEAKIQLDETIYAAIFSGSAPEKKGETLSTEAGLRYLSKLITEKSNLRLGYHAVDLPEDKYEDIEKNCTRIDAMSESSAKEGLLELLK